MSWTRESPTEPGFYVLRLGKGGLRSIAHLEHDGEEHLERFSGSTGMSPDRLLGVSKCSPRCDNLTWGFCGTEIGESWEDMDRSGWEFWSEKLDLHLLTENP